MTATSFQMPRLQHLFLVIVLLKVGCSVAAWYFNSPWLVGFWIPLGLMAVYVVAGFKRDRHDVSDERFGDSCYYLGFVFTISSIAISLLDVPQLDQEGKMKEIAVRFGAAMVSTFLGFIVRAWVAGFKTDADDAVRSVEERLIATARDFETKLELAAERFEALDQQIHKSTMTAMSRVEIAVENAGKASSEGYARVLEDMAKRNREISEGAATQLAAAAAKATTALESAGVSIERMMERSNAAVEGFTKKLEDRLEEVRFPQEMIEETIKGPLNEIKLYLNRYTKSIEKLEHDLVEGTGKVESTMADLSKALSPEGRFNDALSRHYDALGNLIGLAEGTQKLISSESDAITSGFKQLSAAVNAIGLEVQAGRENQVLTDIATQLREFTKRQHETHEQQRTVIQTVKEMTSQTAALAEETKALADAARARQQSTFGRIFGSR